MDVRIKLQENLFNLRLSSYVMHFDLSASYEDVFLPQSGDGLEVALLDVVFPSIRCFS